MEKGNKFNDLSAADLRKVMSVVVNACVNAGGIPTSDIIDIDEVCKITGLSKYTIYKKTSNKEIPFYKSTLSKRSFLRFVRSEIIDWVLKYRVGTIDEFLEKQDSL